MADWHDTRERPEIVYTAEEAAQMDRWLAEERGFTVPWLMDQAGAQLAAVVLELVVEQGLQRVLTMAGPGHNGGDVLVARARLADSLPVEVWQPLVEGRVPRLDRDTLVVDGLFGVGLARPLSGAVRAAVELVLGSEAFVLAVDVPSGLCASSGEVLGVTAADPAGGLAIRADRTLTFVGPKRGFFVGAGPEYVGLWRAVEIGFPREQAEDWVRRRRGQEV